MKLGSNILLLIIIGLGFTTSVLGYLIYQINNSLILLRTEIESDILSPKMENINNENYIKLPSYTKVSEYPLDSNITLDTFSNSYLANAQQSDQGEQNPEIITELQNRTLASSLLNNALVPDLSSMLSVMIRTTIIAALVFLIVKWLGGKGIGQLSPFGLLIVVGLGSAIGDPMIYNEISIPQAMAAVIIAVVFFKAIDYLTLKSKKFRNSVEPKPILLVDYGSLDNSGLKKAKMDFAEFEVQMRLHGIEKVNEIKFARLEPTGQVSFIMKKQN